MYNSRFVGGRLSLCYNALDRHVENGLGDRNALIWDSPVTGNKESITYAQMQAKVSKRIAQASLMFSNYVANHTYNTYPHLKVITRCACLKCLKDLKCLQGR